jgi:hypothetical protein
MLAFYQKFQLLRSYHFVTLMAALHSHLGLTSNLHRCLSGRGEAPSRVWQATPIPFRRGAAHPGRKICNAALRAPELFEASCGVFVKQDAGSAYYCQVCVDCQVGSACYCYVRVDCQSGSACYCQVCVDCQAGSACYCYVHVDVAQKCLSSFKLLKDVTVSYCLC